MAKPTRAWQRMLSGRRLDLLDPSPFDIEVEDIALGLSRVARWNGQTTGRWAFSVAQHSLLVEIIFGRMKPKASAEERLIALLHDAPEFVIGDLISPFKAVVGDSYKALEERLFTATLLRFGLPSAPSDACKRMVKKADIVSAYLEATALAGFEPEQAEKFFGQPKEEFTADLDLTPLPPEEVKAAFLSRFERLLQERA